MNIDYYNLGKPSMKSLIRALQKIVEDNPDINFNKVGVSLNEEYDMKHVELKHWEYKGNKRVCVDIS